MLQNLMFLKKNLNCHETIHDGAVGIKETIRAIGMTSVCVGHRFLKQAKTRGSD